MTWRVQRRLVPALRCASLPGTGRGGCCNLSGLVRLCEHLSGITTITSVRLRRKHGAEITQVHFRAAGNRDQRGWGIFQIAAGDACQGAPDQTCRPTSMVTLRRGRRSSLPRPANTPYEPYAHLHVFAYHDAVRPPSPPRSAMTSRRLAPYTRPSYMPGQQYPCGSKMGTPEPAESVGARTSGGGGSLDLAAPLAKPNEEVNELAVRCLHPGEEGSRRGRADGTDRGAQEPRIDTLHEVRDQGQRPLPTPGSEHAIRRRRSLEWPTGGVA